MCVGGFLYRYSTHHYGAEWKILTESFGKSLIFNLHYHTAH